MSGIVAIQLGDVLTSTANSVYSELKRLLAAFKQEDKELRTRELKKLVGASRLRMYQLLALVSWLRHHETKRFFESLDTEDKSLSLLNRVMAISLDRFFFLNNDLFPMLSRRHEVEVAYDMQRLKTYSAFPRSMFSNDAMASEVAGHAVVSSAPPARDAKQLDANLRGKLALHDKLPRDDERFAPLRATLREGELRLRCGDFFAATLTLREAKWTADWKLVHFQIFRRSAAVDADEQQENDEPQRAMNRTEEETLERVNALSPAPSLSAMLTHLLHTVYRERLLLLVNAFVGFSKDSLFRTQMGLPKFNDGEQGTELCQFFWHNEITNEMSYALRLFLSPCKDNDFQLLIELYGRTELPRDTLLDDRLSSDSAYKLLRSFSKPADARFHLSRTATPLEMLTRICTLLVTIKLTNLRELLQLSSLTHVESIELNPFGLAVHVGEGTRFFFTVDARSGKFNVECKGLGDFFELCRGDISRIEDELNSVQRENRVMAQILDASNLPPPSRSLRFETLLQKMDMVLFLKNCVQAPVASLSELEQLCQFFMPSTRSCAAFALQCWDAEDGERVKNTRLDERLRAIYGAEMFPEAALSAAVTLSSSSHTQASIPTPSQTQAPLAKKVKREQRDVARAKVLYLFAERMPGAPLAVQLCAAICSLSEDKASHRVRLEMRNRCPDIKRLRGSHAEMAQELNAFLRDARRWSLKQFARFQSKRPFSQLILNKSMNEAFIGSSFEQKFGVFCEDSEGAHVSFAEEDALSVCFYTGAEHCHDWGVSREKKPCPPAVKRLFAEKDLRNPVLFASLRLRLLKETDSRSDQSHYRLCVDEFLLEMSTKPNAQGHFLTQDTVERLALQSVASLVEKARLPIDFNWLNLPPLLRTLRATICLVWLTSSYAYNGFDGLDSDRFLRPIGLSREEESATTLRFAFCKFQSDEAAAQARESLSFDAHSYILATVPNPLSIDYEEGDEKLLSITFREDSTTNKSDLLTIALTKLTFDAVFDNLALLHNSLKTK